MKYALSGLTLLAMSVTLPAHAASLQDQLAAVAAAENSANAQQRAQDDARQAQYDREVRAERAQQARAAAASAERQRQRNAAAAAERSRMIAEQQADKKRDQNYEDEMRQLQIEQQKLALKRESARVARENEYIDQDLKSRAAHTDVVQSEADANRNISQGGKTLLQSEGEARVKKASSWFN